MSPLLVSGILVGLLAAATPVLIRMSRLNRLKMVAVPLSSAFFAVSFTLAGNGPLLSPIRAGVDLVAGHFAAGSADRPRTRSATPLNPAPPVGLRPELIRVGEGPLGVGWPPLGATSIQLQMAMVRPDGTMVTVSREPKVIRIGAAHRVRHVRGAF